MISYIDIALSWVGTGMIFIGIAGHIYLLYLKKRGKKQKQTVENPQKLDKRRSYINILKGYADMGYDAFKLFTEEEVVDLSGIDFSKVGESDIIMPRMEKNEQNVRKKI